MTERFNTVQFSVRLLVNKSFVGVSHLSGKVLKSCMMKALVEDLRDFGLSEWEARSYAALATHGIMTATALSEVSRIPASKIYEVLRNLRNKSLAAVRTTKPYIWSAVDPKVALKSMLETKHAATAALEIKTAELLVKLRPAIKSEEPEMFTVRGRKAFLDKSAEMLNHTKSECKVITTRFTRTAAIDAALKSAKKRRIKIMILGTSDVDESSGSRASWYRKFGIIRVLPMDTHPVIGVIDSKEVIVRIDSKEESDYVWSNHPALVAIVRNFFDSMWKNAKVFETS